MWIGLLTQGTHPCRPAASEGVATLFTWGSRERARIDGPQADIAAGVRMMRRTSPSTVGAAFEPRCFDCRRPYLLPDPDEIRAQDDIAEFGADTDPGTDPDPEDPDPGTDTEPGTEPDTDFDTPTDGTPEDDTPEDGPGSPAATQAQGTARAVFALVHVVDDDPVGAEGEALVHVPGTTLVMLIPLDLLPDYAGLLGEAFADLPRQPCDQCGALAPGGSLSEPNRASRRLAVRRLGGGRRAA
jgi:hypothetical protein